MSRSFVQKWKGHELISPAIAPHAPYTVSEEHLKAVRAFSDRTGAPIVTHISETKREVDDSVKAKGASPVDYLDAHRLSERSRDCGAHGLAARGRDRDSEASAALAWFTIRSRT